MVHPARKNSLLHNQGRVEGLQVSPHLCVPSLKSALGASCGRLRNVPPLQHAPKSYFLSLCFT